MSGHKLKNAYIKVCKYSILSIDLYITAKNEEEVYSEGGHKFTWIFLVKKYKKRDLGLE